MAQFANGVWLIIPAVCSAGTTDTDSYRYANPCAHTFTYTRTSHSNTHADNCAYTDSHSHRHAGPACSNGYAHTDTDTDTLIPTLWFSELVAG